jgi:hypothetical protein
VVGRLRCGFGTTHSSILHQTSLFLHFFTMQTLYGGDPHRASKSAIAPTVSVHTAVRFQLDHDFFKRRARWRSCRYHW